MKQRVYAVSLVLAGMVFTADRAFFSAPSASARPAARPNIALASKPASAPALTADGANDLPDLSALSERLQKSTADLDPTQMSDPFRPSPAWLALAEAQARRAVPSPAARFRTQHKLNAVMGGAKTPLAILDGRTVRAGQSIDGFQLVGVYQRSAVFESGDERVEMTLAQ